MTGQEFSRLTCGAGRLCQLLPQDQTPLADVLAEARDNILAYPIGSPHRRFWMRYMGALADFLAAVDGSNLGVVIPPPPHASDRGSTD